MLRFLVIIALPACAPGVNTMAPMVREGLPGY